MRPYSEYLSLLKSESPAYKFHLAGSTPPTPPFLLKKSLRLPFNTATYKADLLKLKRSLAKLTGARTENIEFMPGSTQACFQLLAAITEPGDGIAIEQPGYEPYLAAARFLDLKIHRFARANPNLEQELRGLPAQVKFILLSNPHCPTGHMFEAADLKKLSGLKSTVIVDEVFLPLWTKGTVSLGKSLGYPSNMIFLSGLAKTTGLGLMRGGWVVGPPELVSRVNKIGHHMHSDFPMPLIPVSQFAFSNWRQINTQLLRMAELNRKPVLQFASKHPGYLSHDFKRGFFAMLKAPPAFKNGAAFANELLEHGLFVRNGAHFEMPEWVRFHIHLAPKDFAEVGARLFSYY